MTHATLSHVLRHLHQVIGAETAKELTDSELLERFTARREEAAFAALVQRHGPMVLGVCRRVLHHADLVEDAFQATFLVLVRSAASIRKQASVGSWLYGVAHRVAVKAKARAAKRRARERRSVAMPRPEPLDEMTWHELRAVLDEELTRLPEKYRAAVVLCYLEGRSQEQAARQLGCPRSSLSSRLGRARTLLRQRLTRRGLALSAGFLAAGLSARATAAVPALWLVNTVRAAALAQTGKALAGVVSPHAVALAEGVIKAMFWTKLSIGTLVLALCALVTGVGVLGHSVPPPQRPDARQERRPKAPAKDADPPKKGQAPDLYGDMTARSGVTFTYRNGQEAGHYAILESLGGGVALFDYDGDGLLDIFLTGGGYFAGKDKKEIKGHPCKLYKNLGNWKFRDVTKEVGLDRIAFYSHGCAVADYDRDGWPDLLVTGYGGLALFHNEPDGKGGRRFRDVTKKAGLARDQFWGTSAAWADLDGDGYPDLYVCQYVDWSFKNNPKCFSGQGDAKRDICPPKKFDARPHALYRNNGNGTFTDVSVSAGLRVPRRGKEKNYGKGLGVVIVDVNGDGKPDLFVANDTTGNFLYLNRSKPGQIRLQEEGVAAGVAFDGAGVPNGSKGVDAADYDGTGRSSLFVTNYENEMHGLYRNLSKKGLVIFVSQTPGSGIAAIGQKYVGFGTGFLDVDNDGWEDLVIANGHILRHPTGATLRQRPVLFRNQGGGKFKDISEQGGPYFRTEHLGRGLAVGDLDNDGRPDLVISHLNEPVVLLRNRAGEKGPRNHWLGLELVGNKFGDVTGAKVVVEVGKRPLTRFAKAGGSYLSSGDRRLLFGLGAAKRVDRITVVWPSGKQQQWKGNRFPIDRYWRLVEGRQAPEAYPSRKASGEQKK
jgi:RNA polymerase sigma factor (sigma-70 family)